MSSDEVLEPIDTEQSAVDELNQQIAKLQSQNAQLQNLVTTLQTRLGDRTIEFEVVDKLYAEALVTHRKERSDRVRAENKLRADLKAEYSTTIESLNIEKAGLHQQLNNLNIDHNEVLEKFGRVRHDLSNSMRNISALNADVAWLISLLNAGFKLDGIIGRDINHDDVTNARNKTLVLPTRLTAGKIKSLF